MATESGAYPVPRGDAVEAGAPPVLGRLRAPRQALVTLAVVALVWEVLSRILPPYFFPGWERIIATLFELPMSFVLVTVARVALALAISFAIGLLGSIAMYLSPRVEDYLLPFVKLLMAVPVVCWILFAVIWFRGTEFRIGFVLIVVCAPIFIIDFLDGMRGVPRDLRDMLWSLRPTRYELFTKLILPAIVPTILTSWKINLSLAIRVVTMAELVGATTGIGYGLVVAQELLSVAEVVAWTIILVAVLFLSQFIVSAVERRALRWRE